MKKILVFTSIYGPPFYGGLEISIHEIYKSLFDSKFEIRICSYTTLDSQDAEQRLAPNVSVVRYVSKRFPHPILERSKMSGFKKLIFHIVNLFTGIHPKIVRNEIKDFCPDIIITHNLSGWGYQPWISARRKKIPVIHDNRDFYLSCITTTRANPEKGECAVTCLKCKPREFATKLFWHSGTQIYNSSYTKSILEPLFEGSQTTKSVVIYPPVQLSIPRTTHNDRPYDLGYIGRIEEIKGIRVFLSAIANLDFKVLVAGEGSLLNELSKQYPNITFVGKVETSNFMDQIRVLVVPSLSPETFSRVVLEGMAAGLPTVISNTGAMSEAKMRRGSFLVPVDPLNAIELVEGIRLAQVNGLNHFVPETSWLSEKYQKQISNFHELLTGISSHSLKEEN